MRQVLAAAALAAALTGCTSAVTSTTATQPPEPSSTPSAAAAAVPSASGAPGAAFCAKLKANPKTVQVVYANEVERQVGLASGGGSVGPDAINAARTLVALWIQISCPKFAYLEQNG